MKKLSAILFISVYLFNLTGYSVLFDYFIHQAYENTIQELDNGNYNESELLEIKVPLYVPYYYSWADYERFDGEIELNGTHYNFVKRKVSNDTLYLLCLPNYKKTELYKAKNQFTAKESDSESSPSSKKGMESFGKQDNFDTEYNRHNFQYSLLQMPGHTWLENVFSSHLASCFIPSPVKPPEFL